MLQTWSKGTIWYCYIPGKSEWPIYALKRKLTALLAGFFLTDLRSISQQGGMSFAGFSTVRSIALFHYKYGWGTRRDWMVFV